ncbi:uncharacterized protein LOC125369431 [Ricinus communis]|uniref:uncharacterized protein LOC125369431 n=1 Tax=Ricinus communis TaxID=3988 RepID=UPI00201AEC0D|nr:uncharacterized protein LOC125369431 [Ricinus communis]
MESMLLLGFIGILREALKIFCKNGRIMASIALFTFLAQSILYLANFFSIMPLIFDLLLQRNLLHIATPDTPGFTDILNHIRKDIKILFELELVYLILDSIAFLLSSTATVLAAAIIHGGKEDLSFKDLVLRTARTWTRPLVTWLYINLLGLVYLFGFLAILIGMILVIQNPVILAVAAILLGVSAVLHYIYLTVTWNLAIVVSAVEETRGLKAIIKASEIVKAMKLQGFLMNLLFSISSVVLVQGMNVSAKAHESVAVQVCAALIVVNCASLLRMYWFVAYTVFYYRCKKTHGERVELEERLDDGYSKLPTTAAPLIGHNIP